MIRALAYLTASGVMWLAEGFLFSRFLRFSPWQTALMVAMYLGLFAAAAVALTRALRTEGNKASVDMAWRLLAAAPMLVVVAGSFISLPLLMTILLLGRAR